jgi:hypothetical protein
LSGLTGIPEGQFQTIATVQANVNSYQDNTVVPGTSYQ